MAVTKTTFKRGQGGRKRGSKNKTTQSLREFISNFLNDQLPQLKKDFAKLRPIERLTMFERLLKYSLPALQSTSLDMNFEAMTDEQIDYIIEKLKGNDARGEN